MGRAGHLLRDEPPVRPGARAPRGVDALADRDPGGDGAVPHRPASVARLLRRRRAACELDPATADPVGEGLRQRDARRPLHRRRGARLPRGRAGHTERDRAAQHRRLRRGDDRCRMVRLSDRAQCRLDDRAGQAPDRRRDARVPLPGHRDNDQRVPRDRGAPDPHHLAVAGIRSRAAGNPRARRSDRRGRESAPRRPQRVPLPHHRDPAFDAPDG